MALTPTCCEKCTKILRLLLNPDSEFKMVSSHLNQNQGTMGFFLSNPESFLTKRSIEIVKDNKKIPINLKS